MFVGVGVFGLLAASLASFFIERDREREQGQPEREAGSRLDDIAARLERIEQLLSNGDPPGVAPSQDRDG